MNKVREQGIYEEEELQYMDQSEIVKRFFIRLIQGTT